MGIIKSLLDTDLYKFTTAYAYSKLFPRAYGRFEFIERDNVIYPPGFEDLLKNEIQEMSKIALSEQEEKFLYDNLPYLPPIFIDFLKGYRFNPKEVEVKIVDGRLKIIAEGRLCRVTFWETPILALVSELYFRETGMHPDLKYIDETTTNKAKILKENNITFSLFGMRRRFSFAIEDRVTELLKNFSGDNMYGTSNMSLALKHNLRVSGTHPHEWIQFHAAIYGYKMANYMSMEHWIDAYDGDLGTVLTDTYTTEVFLKNFSKKHAMLYTSLRHDSGDPQIFVDKALKRYEELRVDPKIKYIVFSDSLNVQKAIDIKEYVNNRIGISFGIGTNLSNDVGNGIKARNIVMKLTACKLTEKDDWNDSVKLSDVKGKHTGTADEIDLCKRTLKISD